jgi:hypothetical protein
MRTPKPYNFAAACRLLAPVEWTAACGPSTNTGPQHDHDEALGRYCFKDPPRPRDDAYWDETADLLLDYFELLAGARYSEALEEGFIAWMKCSPGASKCYKEGDDMDRAGLVDWYLRVVL